MRNKSIPELDKLFTEIRAYRKSEELKKLYKFIKKFPQIAPYNAMLIHIQKPGSQYVASAYDWATRFNRTIKPEARPLVILRPFGPVAFVFELGDTEREEPFPEEFIDPFRTGGEVSEDAFNKLISSNIKCDRISYSEAYHGTASAGFIQINKKEKETKMQIQEKLIKSLRNVATKYENAVNANITAIYRT